MRIALRPAGLALFILLCAAAHLRAEDEATVLRPETWVVMPATRTKRVGPMAPDPMAARYILSRETALPRAGDRVPGMASPWDVTGLNKKKQVFHPALRNGYALAEVEVAEAGVYLARGTGHYYFFVNGDPFMGDVYRKGRGLQAVHFRRGKNRVLVRAVRGGFQLAFEKPRSPVLVLALDATLPDVRNGRPLDAWSGVMVVNARNEPLEGAVLEVRGRHFATTRNIVGFLPPLAMRKVPVRLTLSAPVERKRPPKEVKKQPGLAFSVQAQDRAGSDLGEALDLALPVRFDRDAYRETFLSAMDGSVQYFGVRPPVAESDEPQPMFLSLHGASVEAFGQARSYSNKGAGWVVAATNRRPFGFDWEDWGRLDALEVYRTFASRYPVDRNRVYLTGHSMGGHGTWHVGVNHPGLFAAVAPSAGWISFATYSRRKQPGKTGPEAFFRRAQGPSDTLSLKENLKDLGVFIIHGAADDNVPVREARKMVKELGTFHKDFLYREFPGKGHWWDQSKEPGADCVDLAELFDYFGRRKRAEAPRHLRFKTYSPWVSSDHRWVRVLGQEKQHRLSDVEARALPGLHRIEVKTRNVSRLALQWLPALRRKLAPGSDQSYVVAVDGTEIAVGPEDGSLLHFTKAKDAGWRKAAQPPSPALKGPHRYGPFKTAFTRRFVLVYGTQGTDEENAEMLARARYDGAVWWYRGNGAAEIVPDTEFQPSDDRDRNVILYGNRDTNFAYDRILDREPLSVRKGSLRLGSRTLEGDDVACLFVRPRKGSATALVAVVGGTGILGLRGTLLASYFRSGVQYPDYTVWAVGGEKPGLRAVGFFGDDWSLASDDGWLSEGWQAAAEEKPEPEEEDF